MSSSDSEDSDCLEDVVCREARCTLNQQIKKIENSDQKAMSLFRSNILLLGLILTALSIVVQSDTNQVGQFINLCSITGIGFLLLSTFSAAMAYTSSSLDMGIRSDVIEDSESQSYSVDDFYSDTRQSYKEGINHNSDVGSFNATLITCTIISVYVAIILLIGGTLVGAFRMKLTLEAGLLLVGLLAFSAVTGFLIYHAEDLFTRMFPDDA